MNVYLSKNSRYHYKDGVLIRVNNNEEKNLGEEIVYVSKDSLTSLLKKHKIPIRKVKRVNLVKGDKFMADLEKVEMDKNKAGGRFFGLIECLDDYSIFCSGRIIEIKENDGIELRVDD